VTTPEPNEADFIVPAAVLIIDDMEYLLMMLVEGLMEFGYTVFKAQSGERGLEIARDQPVDVVICDLGMPVMNGWEVGRRIKHFCEERDIAEISFIFLTGLGGQVEETEKISESGVDEVIEKPINIKELLDLVARTSRNDR
jgi:DNA-binding response OmpR family regulator